MTQRILLEISAKEAWQGIPAEACCVMPLQAGPAEPSYAQQHPNPRHCCDRSPHPASDRKSSYYHPLHSQCPYVTACLCCLEPATTVLCSDCMLRTACVAAPADCKALWAQHCCQAWHFMLTNTACLSSRSTGRNCGHKGVMLSPFTSFAWPAAMRCREGLLHTPHALT